MAREQSIRQLGREQREQERQRAIEVERIRSERQREEREFEQQRIKRAKEIKRYEEEQAGLQPFTFARRDDQPLTIYAGSLQEAQELERKFAKQQKLEAREVPIFVRESEPSFKRMEGKPIEISGTIRGSEDLPAGYDITKEGEIIKMGGYAPPIIIKEDTRYIPKEERKRITTAERLGGGMRGLASDISAEFPFQKQAREKAEKEVGKFIERKEKELEQFGQMHISASPEFYLEKMKGIEKEAESLGKKTYFKALDPYADQNLTDLEKVSAQQTLTFETASEYIKHPIITGRQFIAAPLEIGGVILSGEIMPSIKEQKEFFREAPSGRVAGMTIATMTIPRLGSGIISKGIGLVRLRGKVPEIYSGGKFAEKTFQIGEKGEIAIIHREIKDVGLQMKAGRSEYVARIDLAEEVGAYKGTGQAASGGIMRVVKTPQRKEPLLFEGQKFQVDIPKTYVIASAKEYEQISKGFLIIKGKTAIGEMKGLKPITAIYDIEGTQRPTIIPKTDLITSYTKAQERNIFGLPKQTSIAQSLIKESKRDLRYYKIPVKIAEAGEIDIFREMPIIFGKSELRTLGRSGFKERLFKTEFPYTESLNQLYKKEFIAGRIRDAGRAMKPFDRLEKETIQRPLVKQIQKRRYNKFTGGLVQDISVAKSQFKNIVFGMEEQYISTQLSPLTRTAQSSILLGDRGKQDLILSELNIQRELQMQKTITLNKEIQRQILRQPQRELQFQPQILKQPQRQILRQPPLLKQLQFSRLIEPPKIPAKTIFPRGDFIGGFGFPLSFPSLKRFKEPKMPRIISPVSIDLRYQPSLAGIYFDIKEPKIPKGKLTGLEIRGLISTRKKKGRRGMEIFL